MLLFCWSIKNQINNLLQTSQHRLIIVTLFVQHPLNNLHLLQVKVSTQSQVSTIASISVIFTTAGGQSVQLAGSVAGGVPVLTEAQGASFTVPASLSGPVLIFQAVPSPALLPSVIGECWWKIMRILNSSDFLITFLL